MSDPPSATTHTLSSKKPVRRTALIAVAALGVGLVGWGGTKVVRNARYAAQVTSANRSLKQIGLGAHNFLDTRRHFPPLAGDGTDDSEVTVPVSFHTSILPFLEQATVYRSIDKSVPWNDPKNKQQFATVLPFCGSDLFGPEKGANGYALAHFVPNVRLIAHGKGISIDEITDGSSNTILTGSIGEAFPAWGDPENGRDAGNGFAGGPKAFGGLKDGALIGLADGSVRFVSSKTSPRIAAALATPAAGDRVPLEY